MLPDSPSKTSSKDPNSSEIPTDLVLEDGSKYLGTLKAGLPHGHGTRLWADGSVYSGSFKDGLPHGAGNWSSSSGECYEGEIANNEFDGFGIYRWLDGSTYTGEFRGGKRHGQGTFIWPDGSSYEGQFYFDKRQGHGIRIYASGGRYEGSHLNDKHHGLGTHYLPNGDIYVGCFFNNRRQGFGTYTARDGTVYKGYFLDGRRHGTGHVTLSDGREFTGVFSNGRPVGETAKQLTLDPFGASENTAHRSCHILSVTREATDQYMKSVDCDFLLIRVEEVWALLTGDFTDRDRQYWSSSIEKREAPIYKYEFQSPSFWLVRGVCHYFDPEIDASDPEYIFLFNPIFQEFRLFSRVDFESLIDVGEHKRLPSSDQKSKDTKRAFNNALHRRPSVAQIKQIVDNEKDKAARIRLRFERSLVSRALIEEYSNLLPVVKKHWQRLENKKAYGGAIPTRRVVKTDVNRTTLAIGDRALDDLGPRSTESDSSAYVCCQCKGQQKEGIFLTCAACLGRICASCCSCEC